ncbi:NEW3 domain-containing protein [Halobacteria archaeon AArc-dxtr1]|nr:NEW3 domain-containing protein [Halobacteria archaeon AArc-dxtr1]
MLAGCLGDDDANGDDANGDDANGDDTNGSGDEPSSFEVDELLPGDETVERGGGIDVSAELTNSGDDEGTQEVELLFDGDSEATESLTLTGGETQNVYFAEIETTALDVGEYEYELVTEDDSVSATLDVDGVLDDDPLLTLDEDEVGQGEQTLSGTISNPYPVPLEDGEIDLGVPDGWELTDPDGTTFDELAALGSQDVTWTLTVPADAEGEHELTASASYTSANESADGSASFPVAIDLWDGIEFVESTHFEDIFEGPDDRCIEWDGDNPACGWGPYEIDLSDFLPAENVQLLFEDPYTDDGYGVSLLEMTVRADGEEIHVIDGDSETEVEEYLVEESGSNTNEGDTSSWRFADGEAWWIYEFDVPEGAEELTVEFEMRNGWQISTRTIPASDVEDPETDPSVLADFVVTDLEPGDTTVEHGEVVSVDATILNNSQAEGTRDVEFTVGGQSDVVELSLDGDETEDLSFEVDTGDLFGDEYEYELDTGDHTASATLTVEGDDREFEEVFHFEDVFDGPDDRCLEWDADDPACGWGPYEADLSELLPADQIQLRFEDSYPDDGFGVALNQLTMLADGELAHTFDVPTEDEAYLVEDNSSGADPESHRWADGEDYWTYQFEIPEDADELTVEFWMRNGWLISGR